MKEKRPITSGIVKCQFSANSSLSARIKVVVT